LIDSSDGLLESSDSLLGSSEGLITTGSAAFGKGKIAIGQGFDDGNLTWSSAKISSAKGSLSTAMCQAIGKALPTVGLDIEPTVVFSSFFRN
jgi:hypothetical protein